MRLAALLALVLALWPTRALATEGECDQFLTVQSIVLSEGAGQPPAAKLEVARVAVSYGPCAHEPGLWTGRDVADRILALDPGRCIANWHCRAYSLLYTIEPAVREPAAVAAHVALTEPHVWRWHVDRWDGWAWAVWRCPIKPFRVEGSDLQFC